MLLDPAWRHHLIVPFMVVALVAYALVAMITELRWVSGLLGAAVGWLLWRQHPRARFAAYVFLSAVGLRGVIGRNWATFCFAMALLVLLQTPAAQRAWPRLTWRWPRHPRPAGREGDADDRMTRP